MPELRRKPAALVPLEGVVLAAIREALGQERDLVLWRNQNAHVENCDLATGRVYHHHAGLPEGSADLVGILRVEVVDTRALHGVRSFGRFFALEVKRARGSRYEDNQLDWLELVRKFGGFASTARSVEEAVAALERARRGEAQ